MRKEKTQTLKTYLTVILSFVAGSRIRSARTQRNRGHLPVVPGGSSKLVRRDRSRIREARLHGGDAAVPGVHVRHGRRDVGVHPRTTPREWRGQRTIGVEEGRPRRADGNGVVKGGSPLGAGADGVGPLHTLVRAERGHARRLVWRRGRRQGHRRRASRKSEVRKGCEVPGQLGIQDFSVVTTGGLTLSPLADQPLPTLTAVGLRIASSDGEASFRPGRGNTKEASSLVLAARLLHVRVPTGVCGDSGTHGDRFELPCLFLYRVLVIMMETKTAVRTVLSVIYSWSQLCSPSLTMYLLS